MTKEQDAAIQAKLIWIDGEIQKHNTEIGKLFGKGDFLVSVVVRSPQNQDMVFITSQEDDLREIVTAVEHLIKTKYAKKKGKA